ncbi:Hypothetical protein A7982_09850 [Minicystis rosea]|nr:Hypothetical protein A7982_09850 [Minicystis rosea]
MGRAVAGVRSLALAAAGAHGCGRWRSFGRRGDRLRSSVSLLLGWATGSSRDREGADPSSHAPRSDSVRW